MEEENCSSSGLVKSYWPVCGWFMHKLLAGGVLTCLSMFGCCLLQAFDHGSGGPPACFGHVYAKTFDRRCADMFGHLCLFANI